MPAELKRNVTLYSSDISFATEDLLKKQVNMNNRNGQENRLTATIRMRIN